MAQLMHRYVEPMRDSVLIASDDTATVCGQGNSMIVELDGETFNF